MDEKLNKEINTFIKTMNEHWSKDLKIRYIYRGLASFFQRDLNYFFADYETQLKQFQAGFKMIDKNIVCLSLCSYYKRVLKRIHIESKIIKATTKEIPHYAMIVHGDFGWFYINPLLDLMVNQVGMITSYFGKTPYQKENTVRNNYPYLIELDFDYVKSLDEQLGFLYYGYYLDDFFEMIFKEATNKKTIQTILEPDLTALECKMKFASDYLIPIANKLSLFERKLFYERLIFTLFSKKERANIKVKFTFDKDAVTFLFLKDLSNHFKENMIFLEKKEKDCYYLSRTI